MGEGKLVIHTWRQYAITKAAAAKFREALREMAPQFGLSADPLIAEAQLEGMRSQLTDLEAELVAWEKTGGPP